MSQTINESHFSHVTISVAPATVLEHEQIPQNTLHHERNADGSTFGDIQHSQWLIQCYCERNCLQVVLLHQRV